MANPPPFPGAPRWAKVSGIIGGVLVLFVVILILAGVGGRHGPDRQLPSNGGHGGAPLPSRVQQP